MKNVPCSMFHVSRRRGFSLVETIVVVSLVGMAAAAVIGSLHGPRGKAMLVQEQATMIRAFELARSRALGGMGEGKHGVHVETDRVVLFEGAAYAGSGEEQIFASGITSDQASSTIVFDRFTGFPNTGTSVLLTGSLGATSSVIVSNEGTVTYSQ